MRAVSLALPVAIVDSKIVCYGSLVIGIPELVAEFGVRLGACSLSFAWRR